MLTAMPTKIVSILRIKIPAEPESSCVPNGAVPCELSKVASLVPCPVSLLVTNLEIKTAIRRGSRKAPSNENSTPLIASHVWILKFPPIHTGASAVSRRGLEHLPLRIASTPKAAKNRFVERSSLSRVLHHDSFVGLTWCVSVILFILRWRSKQMRIRLRMSRATPIVETEIAIFSWAGTPDATLLRV